MTEQPLYPQDPFSQIKEDKKEREEVLPPRTVNLNHAKSDVDSSKQAQHHTLGAGKNQAAGGNHTHTGKDSVLLGTSANLEIGSSGHKTIASFAEADATIQAIISMLAQVISFKDNRTP